MMFWLSALLIVAADRTGATCVAATDGAVAVGGHGGTDLYIEGKREPLGGDKRIVFALAFAGDRLVEAGGRAGERGEIRCWDWKARKLIWKVEEHRDAVFSVAVAGGTVYSGGGDKAIAALDLATGKTKAYLAGHAGAVLALSVSPDGRLLASAGVDRSVRLWNVKDGATLRSIRSHNDSVHSLAWSPDGKYLASGSADRSVRVFQPEIGRLVRIVRDHDSTILALSWSGRGLHSGAADGRIRKIETDGTSILETLEGHGDWIAGIAAGPAGLVSADWTGAVLEWRDGKAPVTLR